MIKRAHNPRHRAVKRLCILSIFRRLGAIESTIVEVTFPALAEAKTDATVEVKDNKGVVREVVARDIAKGATKAQFDFKTPVKADELTGVWTVNGVSYSFDELELVQDIVTAATNNNQVQLNSLLADAGIKNVNTDLIATYATDIVTANGKSALIWASDVQKVVDQTNKDAAESSAETAAVEAVQKANNQIELLNALQANFDRVNAEWIADYAAGANNKAGIKINVGSDNVIYTDASNTTGAAFADVQAAIDFVNDAKINKLNTDADTAAKQVQVTSLIEKWVEADDPKTPNSTPKADAIQDSKEKEAAFRVAEAKTENSLYNALVAYATVTPDSVLKVSELNSNLKAAYKAELDATGVQAALVAQIKTDHAAVSGGVKDAIVDAADTTAETTALSTIDGLTSTNTAAEVKAALQKLADVTSHKTGAAKFDMSTVKDEKLLDYVTLATHGFDAAIINSVTLVNKAITEVNASANEAAYLATIKDEKSTTTQVRDALTALALANSNTSTDAYVNAPAQVKMEVAQFIIDNRANLKNPLDVASLTDHAASGETYAANAIQKAHVDQKAEIAKFNAIGDLASATTTSTKTALDTYGYEAYEALTALQKVAVAEEINKLTKKDSDGNAVSLNFAGDDAVKTLKAANDIIDAAITRVAE